MALDRWKTTIFGKSVEIPIIDDSAPERDYLRTDVAYGLVPRDYSVDPVEMFEPPSEMDLYPESELEDRVKEAWERGETLRHIWEKADGGKQPPNLNQGSYGYCWAHSTTNAVMFARAVANQPYKALSAYMVAAIIKNGRNEGGWCGQSAKFIAENGVCEQRLWPQGDANTRRDTPEVRANAALYKIVEEWRDLTRPIHGQVMSWRALVTSGLNLQPSACDFNWMGHSMCGCGAVPLETGDLGWLCQNSHGGDGWMILRGSRARADGAICIRSVIASAA